MKKFLTILLALGMLCGCMPGIAEEKIITVTPYDFRNDAPDDVIWTPNDATEEELYELLDGDLHATGLLPLDSGGILFTGNYTYRNQTMEKHFSSGFETLPQRMDAYAIALDAEGKRLWSLRIGDPQSEVNSFQSAWRMDDGRILLRYFNSIGDFGSHYFIVSQDGEVEEMLSTKKLRDAGIADTARWFPEGILGGGYEVEDGAISWMTENSALVLLDQDLNEKWRIEDELLLGGRYFSAARSTGDGFLLSGHTNQNESDHPAVIKVSLDGKIEWRYVGHKYAIGDVADIWPTPDGGALFISWCDPSVPTQSGEMGSSWLTKLNADGTHAWSKSFGEGNGFTGFMGMYPLGDGFLLAGGVEADAPNVGGLLYIDAEGNVLGQAKVELPIQEEGWYGAMQLAGGPEGSVYVYGTQGYMGTDENGASVYGGSRAYHVKVDESSFPSVAE